MKMTPDHSSEDESLDIEFASMDDGLCAEMVERDLGADDDLGIEFSTAISNDESCDGIEFSSVAIDEPSDGEDIGDGHNDHEGYEDEHGDHEHSDHEGFGEQGQCESTDDVSGAVDVSGVQPASPLQMAAIEAANDEETTCATRGSFAGTVISVLLHVWLLMNLAQMTIDNEPDYYEPPIDSFFVEEKPEDAEEIEVVNYELANPDDRELEVREVVNAASVGLVKTDRKPEVETAPTPITSLVPTPRPSVYDIPEGSEISDSVVINGTTGEAIVQIESALDRVTWEIANNLKESRVLVVWMLDASGSLTEQRQIVAKRLRRIYGELDALQTSTDQIPRHEMPMLSGVVTYGEKTNFITPNPTEKFQEILDGIQNAPTDPSGAENVFTATRQVVKNWSRYRVQQHRRIMLINLTDEAGDDFSTDLEPAIALCQRHGAKAYVIGPSAVFGRRKGFVPYVAPENGQTYQLPIDLGPESAVIEVVDLPFWYSGSQFTYLSSGYAPYALARLVHETGGIYFMSSMTTMAGLTPVGVFDTARLKPFAPDYSFGSAKEYARDLEKYPLRSAVVQAAFLSREFKANGTPQLDFRVDPGNFRQSATNAQRTVAESQLMIDSVLQAFPDGIEKLLDQEESPRWRVNFCLTYGRLLAQRVRCLEYNSAMAALKGNLSNEDVASKSNHWIIRPSEKLNYSGNLRRVSELATELLKLVVEEAPSTPWAVLAARELKDGLGIEVEQRFIPPPPPQPRNTNPAPKKKQVLFAQEQKKQAPAQPAPKPKPPVLPKL